MRANNALALIFANSSDELLPELTGSRSMASVPFGGRYRIVDFHLSNLVNAGVGKIGIIPRSNYRSLMDHIGAGKPWDLDRKKGGLSFLPPFIISNTYTAYKGHIDAIKNVSSYLEKSSEEYVILCDANLVCNVDVEDMLNNHIKTGADATVAYKYGSLPKYLAGHIVLQFNNEGIATEILISGETGTVCNYSCGIFIFKREKLVSLAREALEKGYSSLSRGIFQRNKDSLRVYGYELKGFAAQIDGIKSFTDANMACLKSDVRHELFNRERPIYTKTRDDMPTRFGLKCNVKNSIIGDGCVIEGQVENCVLFRGVKVGKNSVLRDCIIMQDSVIGDDCSIQYVTADKDAVISDGVKLKGSKNSHYIIKKGAKV